MYVYLFPFFFSDLWFFLSLSRCVCMYVYLFPFFFSDLWFSLSLSLSLGVCVYVRVPVSLEKMGKCPFQKKIQHFAIFPKLIEEMLLFWNSIIPKSSYKKKKKKKIRNPIVAF